MDEKGSLLSILHVDRGGQDAVVKKRVGLRWAGLGAAVLVALIGAAIYARPETTSVRVAVAEEVAATQAQERPPILDASGYIIARRQATVSARIIGRVSHVLIEEGQAVEQDQIIARLDDSIARAALDESVAQVEEAQASVGAARAAFESQESMFRRQTELFAKHIISAQDFDVGRAAYRAADAVLDVAGHHAKVAHAQLRVAQQNLDETIVRAPFAGVITVKAAQTGEIVSPSSAGGFTRTGIGTIVDMDSLELEVEISENFINRIHGQQEAVVTLNAYPDWKIPGEIIAVVPTADRAKATVKIRVGLKVKDARIIPEMGARVSFLEGASPGARFPGAPRGSVSIPLDGVRSNDADVSLGQVFTVVANRAQSRNVHLGAKTQTRQIVLDGLQPGDRVVVGDLRELADESRVRVQP